jgi:hypothetical protein
MTFSALFQTAPGDQPASYTMRIETFPGVEWPGRDVDHRPPSIAEVKEKVELYLYFPLWAFVACSSSNFNFSF